MKQYVQSDAVAKRRKLVSEREEEARALLNSVVRKALAKQKRIYVYIVTICFLIGFFLGVLTKFIK